MNIYKYKAKRSLGGHAIAPSMKAVTAWLRSAGIEVRSISRIGKVREQSFEVAS